MDRDKARKAFEKAHHIPKSIYYHEQDDRYYSRHESSMIAISLQASWEGFKLGFEMGLKQNGDGS